MRLADADVLPLEFTGLADTVKGYLKEVRTLAADLRSGVTERNRQIEEGVFRALLDPRRPTVAPRREDVPPFLNFAPLENAVAAMEKSAKRFESAWTAAFAAGLPRAATDALNRRLLESERLLTDPLGLPRRSWYKHLLYAPGVYTGYGVKTLPGVREALEQKRWSEAETEIVRVARVLDAERALIDAAASDLEAVPKH